MTALPGLAAVIALIFTWVAVNATNNQLQIAEQGQITDRYNAAITNLGSSSIDVRLGGVYALKRIMQDSPRDQPTVVAVLCAFVRDHAHAAAARSADPLGSPRVPSPTRQPPTDIQAALRVVANRSTAHDGSATVIEIDFSKADLSGAGVGDADLAQANLSGADLSAASLQGANLLEADLSGANLSGADLSGNPPPPVGTGAVEALTDLSLANLTGANLTGANLFYADLTEADLTDADLYSADLIGVSLSDAGLQNAHLHGADLTGADLTHAHLHGADLTGADLSGANLSGADLTDADLTHANLSRTNLTGTKGIPTRGSR